MIGITMLVAWMSYASAWWGYSLIKGYNLSLLEIIGPVNYYSGTWPPAEAGNSVIIPDGTTASLANGEGTGSGNANPNASTTALVTASGGAIANQSTIIAAIKAFNSAWGSGQQLTCWLNVIAAESSGNLTAQNPSSGAYGIAQFINGPSEYATYGGNATTVQGQITAMGNYISQRYGTPCAAWAHEQSSHWY